jgi:hypothetical protein
MKMSAVETEMVVRNLNAGLLRAITHITLGTILDLKLGREMRARWQCLVFRWTR